MPGPYPGQPYPAEHIYPADDIWPDMPPAVHTKTRPVPPETVAVLAAVEADAEMLSDPADATIYPRDDTVADIDPREDGAIIQPAEQRFATLSDSTTGVVVTPPAAEAYIEPQGAEASLSDPTTDAYVDPGGSGAAIHPGGSEALIEKNTSAATIDGTGQASGDIFYG